MEINLKVTLSNGMLEYSLTNGISNIIQQSKVHDEKTRKVVLDLLINEIDKMKQNENYSIM